MHDAGYLCQGRGTHASCFSRLCSANYCSGSAKMHGRARRERSTTDVVCKRLLARSMWAGSCLARWGLMSDRLLAASGQH
ncbi:hypothetical protein NDU88_009906 [Pleurodeles waltl]|uniref:Uncharacterized protein n=1 Tax=Pleurodeles waltl TaxID=8319 RepID=A0AAV7PTE7_PLEWA|nr:hypothetical protein NDU88_009906 [Pleurodeles waltl]